MRLFSDNNTLYHNAKTVRFQGKVIVLASRASTTGVADIYYRVLDLTVEVPEDEQGWTNLRKLAFPKQLRPAGMSLLTLDLDATQTAADVPFDVVSDNQHIYLFRQSTHGTLYVNRYVFDGATNQLNPNFETRYQRSRKHDVPAGQRDTLSFRDLEEQAFLEPTLELAFVENLTQGWFSVLTVPSTLPGEERWLLFAYNGATEAMDAFSIRRSDDGWFDLTSYDPDQHKTSFRLSQLEAEASVPLTFQSGPSATLYMKQEEMIDEYGRRQRVKRDARVMLAIATGPSRHLATLDFAVSQGGTIAQLSDIEAIPPLRTEIARIEDSIEELERQQQSDQEYALNLVGDGSGVTVAATDDLTPLERLWTVEAWVRTVADEGIILLKDAASNTDFYRLRLSQGRAAFAIHLGDDETETEAVSTTLVNDEEWHHLVGVRRDVRTVEIWVDGVLESTGEGTGDNTSINSDRPLRIGQGRNTDPAFVGQIDQVRIWRVARTEEQIRIGSATPLGLVSDWQFNEGQGTQVGDSRGRNAGTLAQVTDTTWVRSERRLERSLQPLNARLAELRAELRRALSDRRLLLSSVAAEQPLPQIFTDPMGLTVNGGVLEFASADATPTLVESNDGLVHLYFQGAQNEFFVAQYNVSTQKATYLIRAEESLDGQVRVEELQAMARWSGTPMNRARLQIEDQGNDLCRVTLEATVSANRVFTADEDTENLSDTRTLTEVWEGVPRHPVQFMAVLNGVASQDLNDPEVEAGRLAYYDYQQARSLYHLPTGTGFIRFVARQPQGLGFDRDAAITITGDHPQFCTVTLDNGAGVVETWQGVPRQPQQWVAVLSGRASRDATDPMVQRGRRVYYAYETPRPVHSLPLGNGRLQFVGLRNESEPGSIRIDGEDEAVCRVMLVQGTVKETWEGVPRDPHQFALVINGNASSNPDDPAIQSGEQVFYDYRNARPTFLLNPGEGRIRFVRAEEAQLRAIANQPSGAIRDVQVSITDTDPAEAITVNVDPIAFCTVTLTVRVGNRTLSEVWPLVPREARDFVTVLAGRAIGSDYDYALAQPEGFEADLINGSILFSLLANDLTEIDVVENTADRPVTELRTVTIEGASRDPNRNGSLLFAVIDDGSVERVENTDSFDQEAVQQIAQVRGARPNLRSGSSLFAVMDLDASGSVINHESGSLPLQRVILPLQDLSNPLQGPGTGLQSSQPLLGSTLFRFFPTAALAPDSRARIETVDIIGPDRLIVPGTDCSWIPEPPRNALQFGGGNHVRLQPSPSLDLDRDITVETWVNPTTFASNPRIISYNNGDSGQYLLGILQNGRLLAATRDQAVETVNSDIPLNQWTHLAATYDSSYAVQLDGANDSLDCGNNASLNVSDAITIEAWVTPERSGVEQVIASRWGTDAEEQSWQLALNGQNRPYFSVRNREGKDINIQLEQPLQLNRTYHVVGVFDGAAEEISAIDFEGSQFINVPIDIPETEVTIELWFKASAPTGGLFRASDGRAESRYDRTLFLLDGNLNARLTEEPLNGPGHIATTNRNFADGLWHHIAYVFGSSVGGQRLYVDGELAVSSGDRTASSFAQSHINIGFANDAGIASDDAGNNYFRGLISEVRIWNHVRSLDDIRDAMTQRLTGNEFGLLGYWLLNSIQEGRVEDRAGNRDGLVNGSLQIRQDQRGRFVHQLRVSEASGGSLQQQASWTALQSTSLELLGYENEQNNRLVDGILPDTTLIALSDDDTGIRAGEILTLGREQVRVLENRGSQSLVQSDGESRFADLILVRRGINGINTSHDRGTRIYRLQPLPQEISGSDASVYFGQSDVGQRVNQANVARFLQGQIHQVRLWNVGRRTWELDEARDRSLTGNEDGLIGYWRFDEGEGTLAFDSKGENHAQLRGGDRQELIEKWLPSPTGSRWTLYVNGEVVESGATSGLNYGDANHARLGGLQLNASQNLSFFGMMDDVRIWNIARTAEQIRDSLYRPLAGSEDGLVAYWRFDDVSVGAIATDQSPNGNDGELSAVSMRQPSNAPIGNEGPEVINVLSPVIHPFNRQIQGQGAIAEYGDLQYDIDGNLIGVLKRCYVYTDSANRVQLVTGYKIGDLDLQFIGQVQSRPTLIGYIEGAPPVPSENLTVQTFRPYLYVGNTSVELTEANDTVQVYSASMDSGRDTSFDFKGGLYANIEVESGFVAAYAKNFTLESKLGLHTTFEASNGWTRDASLSVSSGTTLSNSLVLGGALEEPADYDNTGTLRYLNPTVGQRFVPANVGYALVRSGTANLFATRLRQTGSLVSFQTIPNPDIPEDVNIIMFPMNAQYTKNGTLDGKVGLVNDPDYPNADSERGSYFKPLEAYALREQIEREKQDILAYFENYNVGEQASEIRSQRRGGLTAEFPNLEGLRDLSQEGEDEGVGSVLPDARFREQIAQRSLVNTYVWTADGGLYAEEEEFSSIRQESLGRYFANQGQLGLNFEIAAAAGIGGFAELDALFGGHLDVSVVKDQADQSAFGLKVQVEGDGFINQFDPETGQYLSTPAPGKVDTYRFMSFYLAPKADHFDTFFSTVVDPLWLRTSQDANARALREAEAEKNRIWRVMHRVTFVSRIPPQFDDAPQQSQDGGVRRPANLDSNELILDLVRRQVVSRNPQPREIGTAVDLVFDQDLKEQLLYWAEFLNRAQRSYRLPTSTDPENESFVRLVARPETSEIRDLSIQVAGTAADSCTVTLSMTLIHPAPSDDTPAVIPLEEVWNNVSRTPQVLVNTLNGTQGNYNYGANQTRSMAVYPVQVSFNREIHLVYTGEEAPSVRIRIDDSAIDSSSCQLTIEATPTNGETVVETWPNVSRRQEEFIDFINRNSALVTAIDNGSSGEVRNQSITAPSQRSILVGAELDTAMGISASDSVENATLNLAQAAAVAEAEQLADLRQCAKTYVQAYFASMDGV